MTIYGFASYLRLISIVDRYILLQKFCERDCIKRDKQRLVFKRGISMAHFLHRLGKYCFERAWWVISVWLIVLAIVGVLAVNFMKPPSDGISIPGTEGQKALDRMSQLFPDTGKGSGRIVFEAAGGKTMQNYSAQVTSSLDAIKKVDGVSGTVSPFDNPSAISKDQTIGYAEIELKNGNGEISKTTLSAISSQVANARSNGLTVEMGGDLISKNPGEILGVGEIVGVLVALLVLVMTLGSLVSAGMPIATALMAIGVSMAGLFALSQVVNITSTTPVLAVMLGLAVGIDYSLFIISKYRSYLLEGFNYPAAAARAIGTAGNAVVFAALTVVIALSALTIVQIPFMSTMGLAGAATIATAAMVAVTLIPALMKLAEDKIFGRKMRSKIAEAQKKGPHEIYAANHVTFWYKWGEAIAKRPVVILVLGIIVIAAIAWPVRSLQLGLPTDEYAAKTSTERKAYDLLVKGFGAGFNAPLIVVVENIPAPSVDDAAKVRAGVMDAYQKQVAAQTAAQQAQFATRAAAVVTPEQGAALQQDIATAEANGVQQQREALIQVDKQIADYTKRYELSLIANNFAKLSDVDQAVPALITSDATKGAIQIIPKSAPSDSKTSDLIAYIRNSGNKSVLTSTPGVTFSVTGSTALDIDIIGKLSNALPLYLGVVVGLSLVLLILAFRSILIPIKATLGFLLSVLAMFGALVAAFQWGWFGIAEAPGPIVSFIPIIAIGVLFGLAMDYEFFLVSSMHESYEHTKDARRAVVDGFGLGSRVVTAAGIIMVSVFSGFIFNQDATVKAIGFALALGIFVDAFIVRMTIVPAVMTLLGKSAWWLPRWLDAIIPHVSIEGEEEVVKEKKHKKA